MAVFKNSIFHKNCNSVLIILIIHPIYIVYVCYFKVLGWKHHKTEQGTILKKQQFK